LGDIGAIELLFVFSQYQSINIRLFITKMTSRI